jgi:hypothetical protein
VWDLVLGGPSGTYSLELIEEHFDIAVANGVFWGDRLALATALLHFSELEAELELRGSGCNANLMEDQVDALWT